MSDELPFDSISLTNQIVLLGVAEFAADGETPIQTHELRKHCRRNLADADAEVAGTITEADVIRSLYRLEDLDLVDEVESSDRSPTGKGRPAYALAVPVDAVYEGITDDLLETASD
jgi:hypothetical protein